MRIKGITVNLIQRTEAGRDPFNAPIYEEVSVPVDNVLVAPSTQGGQDVIDAQQLYGKTAQYILAIPKGDDHEWADQIVEFFGQRFRVFGMPTTGIEDNIPLGWNKKVLVERYG